MVNNHSYYKDFEDLFRSYYTRLFYYALDWVEDSDTAKDLVSEVFTDVWDHYPRLTEDKIESYLYTAVRNRCINYLKHQIVEKKYQQEYLSVKETYIPEDYRRHEAELQLIETTIETFSPETRIIFDQCYFQGKTYQEMANVLKISVSAVHKHMNKAFVTFRKVFKNFKDKEG